MMSPLYVTEVETLFYLHAPADTHTRTVFINNFLNEISSITPHIL